MKAKLLQKGGSYMVKVIVDEHEPTERTMEFIDVEDIENMITELPAPLYDTDSDYNNKVWEFLETIFDQIPNIYRHDIEWSDIMVATNEEEFLFRYENDCEHIADLLDKYLFGCYETHTGYYDPDEDEKSGETDENTGWYYLDFD